MLSGPCTYRLGTARARIRARTTEPAHSTAGRRGARVRLLALVCFLAGLLALGCEDPSTDIEVAEEPEAGQSVLLLGDSITYGLVSGHDPSRGPTSWAVELGRLRPQDEIINEGLEGGSTFGWVGPLWEPYAQPHLPVDRVVILLGTNDVLYVTPPETLLEHLVDLAGRAAPAEVFVITPPRTRGPDPMWPITQQHSEKLLKGYRDAILEACAAPGGPFLCGPDIWLTLDPERLADGVHPDNPGHAHIAEEVDRVLSAHPSSARQRPPSP